MNWFYVLNGYRAGPVPAAELLQLLMRRTIASTTPIWRDGMEDWQPYAQVAATEPGLTATLTCTLCRGAFPPDQVLALGTGRVCAHCQPAAQAAFREGIPLQDGLAPLRKRYLGHETSLKSAGNLFLLLGGLLVVAGGMMLVPSLNGSFPIFRLRPLLMPVGIGLMLFGAFQFLAGLPLRRLRPTARIPAGIIAGLGLLAIPFGTLLGAYVLYLLFSPRGKFILSPDYPTLIAATPEIKYRASRGTLIAIGVLLLPVLGILAWLWID